MTWTPFCQLIKYFHFILSFPFQLPTLIWRQLFSRYKPGLIFGLGLYHKPLLVTYARSGTNWIRYFIEEVTSKPTPGNERLVKGKANFFMDRAHGGYAMMHRYSKVILVIRNYRECLIRHHSLEKVRRYPSIDAFLSDESHRQSPDLFIRNIHAFDQFEGEKMLLYYEDLVKDPALTLEALGQFLELEHQKVAAFLKNLNEHKQRSVNFYSKDHGSQTQGKIEKIESHSASLTSKEIESFDSFYQNNYPKLFDKYLTRYVKK